MGESYRPIEQMQQRIDQLAVEPWANGEELEDTYEHLLSAYQRMGVENLSTQEVCYVLDGHNYREEQSKEILNTYREIGPLELWEAYYLDTVLCRTPLQIE